VHEERGAQVWVSVSPLLSLSLSPSRLPVSLCRAGKVCRSGGCSSWRTHGDALGGAVSRKAGGVRDEGDHEGVSTYCNCGLASG